jgi:hypothetical protein
MKSLLTIGLSIAFLTTLNFFFTKYNFLLDKKVLPHKLFTSKDAVPLTGGFLLFISLFFFNNNAIFIAFSLFIFTLGVFADLNIVKNSTIKFIIQSIVVFFFFYIFQI